MYNWAFEFIKKNAYSERNKAKKRISPNKNGLEDPFPGVLGSGSVSYSNEHNTINWKGKFNKVFWLGPVGPTDKENQVQMYKKYCFRYIISLKR